MNFLKMLCSLYCLACLFMASTVEAARPNIILIMVDDMGFSDIGCYGGEIETPHIDALAAGGVRFSQFYNSGRCCPTRATLMTGLHPQQTGIGWMTNPPGDTRGYSKPPAYQGYLNRKCVTLAEVLKPAGYATLMTGKWHLGFNAQDRWPLQRGFDKYFGCVSGATRFFHPVAPRGMTFGNEDIETPASTTDRPFYTTDAYTDYAIRFLNEHQQDKPFFLYLAYTAPHWPLQAHEEEIRKYRGKYKIGWDELREQRLAKQKELGLLPANTKLSPRDSEVPAWDTLSEKKQDEMDLKMAIYAAMVDRVDQNIGKLVNSLKSSGQYENTLVLFLSDNGGCAEGGVLGRGEFYDIEKRNLDHSNSYGKAWANASNTPFRLYKHFAHEGGTSTPFFMHWPAEIKPQTGWITEPAQLIDIMPTLIDVAEAKYPETFNGNRIPALDGITLRPAMQGEPLNRTEPLFIEHESNAFVRAGDWKLVGRGVSPAKGYQSQKWELYDLKTDRTELNNLATRRRAIVNDLAHKWEAWAKRVGVYPK
ncbi:arylsulfatase [Gimesia sp.]|uniref:arylsulfatase n=1 Tax=Gimesia sp. TaxID=2024833 RepID=UPI003A941453